MILFARARLLVRMSGLLIRVAGVYTQSFGRFVGNTRIEEEESRLPQLVQAGFVPLQLSAAHGDVEGACCQTDLLHRPGARRNILAPTTPHL